jgi:ketosteroid isomerase-like protein
MRQLSAVAVATAFAIAPAAPVSAQAHEHGAAAKKTAKAAASMSAAGSVEEQIKKMEKERAAAITKGDVKTLESLTADDYTMINRYGQMTTKAQTMGGLRTGETKITAYEPTDLVVRVYGDTAVVTGAVDMKGTMAGKDASGKVLFTRVYVKGKDGSWKSVAFQQTPVVKP